MECAPCANVSIACFNSLYYVTTKNTDSLLVLAHETILYVTKASTHFLLSPGNQVYIFQNPTQLHKYTILHLQ